MVLIWPNFFIYQFAKAIYSFPKIVNMFTGTVKLLPILRYGSVADPHSFYIHVLKETQAFFLNQNPNPDYFAFEARLPG
jgi:hypothetical protein